MTDTFAIRIHATLKKRLDALSKRSKRSKAFLVAEAITAYVESEERQIGEIRVAICELDARKGVSHEKVSGWLKTWGKTGEEKAPL